MSDNASRYSKHVQFTLNNPELTSEAFKAKVEAWSQVSYCVFQLEKGESGNLHFQGHLSFKRAQKYATIHGKLSSRLSLRPLKSRKHIDNNIEYCQKEESRVEGPWEIGERPVRSGQGNRSDLSDAVDILKSTGSIKSVALQQPEVYAKYSVGLNNLARYHYADRTSPPTVRLYYGAPGTGKTRMAMSSYSSGEVYIHEPGSRWFDGYDGHNVMVLDDFAGSSSGFRLDYTLRLLDRYPLRLPIKGSHVPLMAIEIILTTNIHPYMWFKWETREVQFAALARRFHEIRYFPPSVTHESFVCDHHTFFEDFAEFADDTSFCVQDKGRRYLDL